MDMNITVKAIVNYVGGKANIIAVTHCATRLRFKLADNTKADKNAIENLDGVLGTGEGAGTFQVIVGMNVESYYKELEKLISSDSVFGKVDDDGNPLIQEKLSNRKKGKLLDNFLEVVSSIFTPYVPLLGTYGVITGIIGLLAGIGILDAASPTYMLFNAMARSVIYFFPILLGYTSAKRFGANPYVGAAIGGALVYPEIIDILSNGTKFTFLGLNITGMSFGSTVLPIIFSMYCFAKLEALLKKYLPKSIQFIFVPALSVTVITTLTILIIGPVGNVVANVILSGFELLMSTNMIIFGVFFGGIYIFIILFGLHWALLPIQITYWTTYGMESSLVAGSCGLYSLLGICLAVAVFSKDKKQKEIAFSAAFTNFLSGVSEPGLYGICMRDKRYFIALFAGGATGGFICGLFSLFSYNIANAGILSFASYFTMPNVGIYIIAILASAAVAFAIAAVVCKKEKRR